MRMGIRAKLIGTLLLAGLLPLALALGVILIGVVELRIHSRGRMYRALAQQQANHLSTILASQVELANLTNALPGTVEFLHRANEVPPLSQAQIDKIEAAWPALPASDPLIHACLENEIARRWQSVARDQRRFAEVMITDLSGRLVAATNKTSDYFQADEDWWRRCYDNGHGRPLISDVLFDESARAHDGSQGALVADVCLPIYDTTDPASRKLIGITKFSLDATWMLRQVDLGAGNDDLPRATWLVSRDGKAIPGARPPAPVSVLPPRVAQQLRDHSSGYLRDDQVKGYELIGFASVEQTKLMEKADQRWHVVVATGVHQIVSSLYRLAWIIFVLGLTVITACFFGGVVIARREIIRPIQKLEYAAKRIQEGDREFRLSEERGGKHTFRDDEIGSLARNFNLMADELRGNIQRLEQADALKRQFIDLASHELRTPVTYILGAAQLAEHHTGNDPATLGILTRIAAKALRLTRIVENMFKLLASDRFEPAERMTAVDVAALVQAVCQENEPFLHERHQSIKLELAGDLPPIEAEKDKIRDILSNLISNAIRFSPDGGVIGVRAGPTKSPGVEIAVSDNGPGIPSEDLSHLFEPFFTGADVALHTSGDFQHMSRGMGLGLSVVKRFVDLHGGTVTVDTSPGGTTIRVTLPATRPD
jgi:signal transduction histidine kinase